MSEIWYDSNDNTVKAVYSGRYSGTVWADAGYLNYRDAGPLAGGFLPGAVIEFDGRGVPSVVTPAPPPTPPEPTPRELREAALAAKFRARTATTDEVQEFLVSRLNL